MDPAEMKTYEITDKEFRLILLKKFREPQDNVHRKPNKSWKTSHRQNEKFGKQTEKVF